MKESAYKKAGVDIDAGDALVERIVPLAARTARPGVMEGLGGFGALFDLKREGFSDPVLVSSTDGVGTKLKIAIEAGLHDTVGIDLVAMSVNDIVTTGAQPLFFLDYFACGKLDVGVAARVIAGIAEGCALAGCALVGGETAEMPGMYADGDYDLAGFAVAAAERKRILDRNRVKEGDIVLGLASSGVHSNGYSLVRRIVRDSGLRWDTPCPFDQKKTLGEALMAPTRIYTKALAEVLALDGTDGLPAIHALAHITGSGLPGNAARTIPDTLALQIDAKAWALPEVFRFLAQHGKLTADDLSHTFNCGIGMIVVVEKGQQDKVRTALEKAGERVFTLGEVIPRNAQADQVIVHNRETAWA